MVQGYAYPRYREVDDALLIDLVRRGGRARPRDQDSEGRTVYEAVADFFGLSQQARTAQFLDDGRLRTKWHNMVRFARRHLKDKGYVDTPERGLWRVTNTGLIYCRQVLKEFMVMAGPAEPAVVSPEEFAEAEKEAREIGQLGETFVVRLERRRLTAAGRPDLADLVQHTALTNVAAGYDVLSYSTDGSPKYIEVKSTTADSAHFELTDNEYQVAKTHRDCYWIFRVFDIRRSSPSLLCLQDPARLIEEQSLIIRPMTYAVTISENLMNQA